MTITRYLLLCLAPQAGRGGIAERLLGSGKLSEAARDRQSQPVRASRDGEVGQLASVAGTIETSLKLPRNAR
jgi:hypothetical protein